MAETGRVYDGVEGAEEEEDDEYGGSGAECGAYGDYDSVLSNLCLLAW
jgi:hypothetical protein